MRLCTLALAGLLATGLDATAQTPAAMPPAPSGVAFVTPAMTSTASVPQAPPELVVTRMMSFDRNHDGRITVNELSERMQGLVARGDRGGDGALDAAEIRDLAMEPASVQVKDFSSVFGSGGGYGFGDEVGFSSRMHIEGAIDDLRLASDRRDQALAIATAFADRRAEAALSDLITTMTPLLSEEELRVFTLVAEQSAHSVGFRIMRADSGTNAKEFVEFKMLVAQMQRFQLDAKQPPEATGAIKRFKERQQLSEPDRAQLLSELKDILTAEEGDDLNAALARRPVVKKAGALKTLDALAQIKVVGSELNVRLPR